MHPTMDLETIAARLRARRAEITDLMSDSADERRPVALDQAQMGRLSRADAMQRQAMAQETERRRAVELERIDAALGRIEDGSYGACVRCGEPVGAKRLALDPTAALCIDCARG